MKTTKKIYSYKVKYLPKDKMKVGKGKTNSLLGDNPEAAKKVKVLAKPYQGVKNPSKTILVRSGQTKKNTKETIKHEKEEAAGIKYKGESYAKAHRRAERDETKPMSQIKRKIVQMKKGKK